MNIQHSSRTDEWGTPLSIIIMCRQVMNCIHYDPASSGKFNKFVEAEQYCTKEQDGLKAVWPSESNIFINPPGGKTGNKSNTTLFWKKLMEHKYTGCLRQAIFLAFSAEALQTTQGKGYPSIGEFTICIPKRRIAFVGEDDTKQAPSHSNCIAYIPGTIDRTYLFKEVFSDLGIILN